MEKWFWKRTSARIRENVRKIVGRIFHERRKEGKGRWIR
jgi:hypothetical protein